MIQWLNKEKNESMRTKRNTFNTNKYATYRDPSLMQNVILTPISQHTLQDYFQQDKAGRHIQKIQS